MSEQNEFVTEKGVLKKYMGADPHVVFPEGVTKIGTEVFFPNRDRIVSVAIPEGVKVIGENAFYN